MVNVPDLKLGPYTMQIALDTKSPLGTLVSKRIVEVEDPVWNVQSVNYVEYLKEGNAKEAAKARETMLRKWFKRRVKSGQPCAMDDQSQVTRGVFPGSDKLSGVLKWYPGRDYVRVRAEVTDAFFSTDALKDTPWKASSLLLYLSASGVDQDIVEYVIVPEGAGGIPRIQPHRGASLGGLISAWKRTDKGYVVDVKIPWTSIRGYEKGWRVLPVQAAITSKTDNGRTWLVFNRAQDDWNCPRAYAGLERE